MKVKNSIKIIVVKTTGPWEKLAGVVLQHIARALASRTGEEPDTVHTALLQELCVVVRGFGARASLRRRSEASADYAN